jgi:hypothetical protein
MPHKRILYKLSLYYNSKSYEVQLHWSFNAPYKLDIWISSISSNGLWYNKTILFCYGTTWKIQILQIGKSTALFFTLWFPLYVELIAYAGLAGRLQGLRRVVINLFSYSGGPGFESCYGNRLSPLTFPWIPQSNPWPLPSKYWFIIHKVILPLDGI